MTPRIGDHVVVDTGPNGWPAVVTLVDTHRCHVVATTGPALAHWIAADRLSPGEAPDAT